MRNKPPVKVRVKASRPAPEAESLMEQSTSGEKPTKKAPRKTTKELWLRELNSLIIKIIVILAVFLAVTQFVFGLTVNSGMAMDPAVKDRDLVVFYRWNSDFKSGDLAVFKNDAGELSVLRVVAVEGDTVDVTSEGLKVNGYVQQEDYAVGETLAVEGGPEYPVTLGAGEVFLLGDNRESALDSRSFGPVSNDKIKGDVVDINRRSSF